MIDKLVVVALMAALLTILIGPIAYFVSTPYEDVEQQQAALDNSGYNWTEVNYTTFETEVECGFRCITTVAQEQCANGIQEACDYMTIKNVDYHDRNGFENLIWDLGGFLIVGVFILCFLTSPFWGSLLAASLTVGLSKRLGWDN